MGVSPKRRWEIGQAAGLLGVVLEVALRVHIGVVADDLDGVLVGADGTVGAQAVELAGDRCRRERRRSSRRCCREVPVTSSLMPTVKWFFGLRQPGCHNTALTMVGVELLGAQAVAAADNLDIVLAGFVQRSARHPGKGARPGSRAPWCGRARRSSCTVAGIASTNLLHAEGTIQVNLHQADLCAAWRSGNRWSPRRPRSRSPWRR